MNKEDILVEIRSASEAVTKLEKVIQDAKVGIENNQFVADCFKKKYKELFGEDPKEEEWKVISQLPDQSLA